MRSGQPLARTLALSYSPHSFSVSCSFTITQISDGLHAHQTGCISTGTHQAGSHRNQSGFSGHSLSCVIVAWLCWSVQGQNRVRTWNRGRGPPAESLEKHPDVRRLSLLLKMYPFPLTGSHHVPNFIQKVGPRDTQSLVWSRGIR